MARLESAPNLKVWAAWGDFILSRRAVSLGWSKLIGEMRIWEKKSRLLQNYPPMARQLSPHLKSVGKQGPAGHMLAHRIGRPILERPPFPRHQSLEVAPVDAEVLTDIRYFGRVRLEGLFRHDADTPDMG